MSTKNNINKKAIYRTIGFNILGVLSIYLLFISLRSNTNYKFVFEMLQRNYNQIVRYSDAPLEERYKMKLRNTYYVFNTIAENTPKDAVVYLPGGDAFSDNSNGFEVSKDISVPYIKGLAARFLHPRKVVLESELQRSKYSNDITHIVIINQRGSELMSIKFDSIPTFAIIPVHKK